METRQEEMQLPTPALEVLEDLLRRETQTYHQVIDVMRDKSQLIADGNYHELAQCDQKLLALGQSTIMLEQERIQLLQRYSQVDIPLNQLISQLGTDRSLSQQKNRLQETRLHLLEAIESIRLLNLDHRRMLTQSSKWVSETLKLVQVHNTPDSASYQATGKKVTKGKPNATNPIQSTVIRDA